MQPFKNPQEFRAFVTEQVNAASMPRMALAASTGVCECYYEGVQYLNAGLPQFGNSTSGRSLLPININPDSQQMRVVWNKTTERTIKSAAATWVEKFDNTVDPPLRDSGVEASRYSQVHEDALAAWIKRSGIVKAARRASHRRCVSGCYGLMLTMVSKQRTVEMGGQALPMQDMEMGVVPFHPLRLILDPDCEESDLNLHQWVIYSDVWTHTAIKRAFPNVKLVLDDLKTVGQLTPYEQEVSRMSGGKLFQRFRDYSNTKGARVYQLYQKDAAGKWSIMYAAVETGNDKWETPNFENPTSPFGCHEVLPMVLLQGHQRTSSPFGIGDVAMSKDSQDVLNLTATQWFRVFKKHAGFNWIVDKRWLGRKVSDEDSRDKFHNAVGGVIMGDGSSDKTVQPPQLVSSPAPNPTMLDMLGIADERLQASTFRNAFDSGVGVKTHTPTSTMQLAQQNSGQVLGIRVAEDRDAYSALLDVALCTVIKMAQEARPSTLAMLTEAGFDESDMEVVVGSDPQRRPHVTISEASIRYRSTDEKQAKVMEMVTAPTPVLTGPQALMALADLDLPVTEDNRHMQQQLTKQVCEVLKGKDWVPLPLGPYNDWALTYLRRALLDKKARRDPQIQAKIAAAIQAQTQLATQEAIASDPALVAQQQQAQMQMKMQAQQAAQEEAGEEEPPPENVGQLVERLAAPAA